MPERTPPNLDDFFPGDETPLQADNPFPISPPTRPETDQPFTGQRGQAPISRHLAGIASANDHSSGQLLSGDLLEDDRPTVDHLLTSVLQDSRLRTPLVTGTSLMIHTLLALLLACILYDPRGGDNEAIALITTFGKESDVDEHGLEEEPALEMAAVETPEPEALEPPEEEPPPPVEESEIEPVEDLEPAPTELTRTAKPKPSIIQTSAVGEGIREHKGVDVAGRAPAARQRLVAAFGGTVESENAVQMGLEWLTRHQRSDGSWSFQHFHGSECRRECSSPGSSTTAKNGATAMALLCYLGAGHNHVRGPYRTQVYKGLQYLLSNIDRKRMPGDLRNISDRRSHDGMYVQGLATMALCEALAMSNFEIDDALDNESNIGPADTEPNENDLNTTNGDDEELDDDDNKPRRGTNRQKKFRPKVTTKSLQAAAQLAVHFIELAQDPAGGGWRYIPKSAGDTSVLGWQVMALQSARTAGLRVERTAFVGARQFLNGVSSVRGSRYGYTSPSQNNVSMTAVGLLSQMYLGWDRDNPALELGVSHLATLGPSTRDMYYNFYATQIMHHWGGPAWENWNEQLREHLVSTQNLRRHAKGSWDVKDPHGNSGGRLYMTCLCIMTLEVYYRHMPLYRQLLSDDDAQANAADVIPQPEIE